MSLSCLAWSVLRLRVLIHDKDIRNSLYLKDVSVIMRVGLDDAIELGVIVRLISQLIFS